MNPTLSAPAFHRYRPIDLLRKTDWIFLGFLLLVCNQAMLIVKLLGFVLIYLLRPNLRFRLHKGRLPLLYVALPVAGLLSWMLHVPDGSNHYVYAFAVGTVSWLLCLAASHQIRLSIEKKGTLAMGATLRVFTMLNFIACVGQLIVIASKTGHLNPYDIRVPFPYGMSSGDRVFGVLLENAPYNMMVTIMLMLYFIFQNSRRYALLAAASALAVFSNFGNLIYVGILLVLLLSGVLFSGKQHPAQNRFRNLLPPRKSLPLMGGLLLLLPLFYMVFSPQNFDYFVKEKEKAVIEKLPATPSDQTAAIPENQTLWQRVQQLDFKKYRQPLSGAASTQTPDGAARKQISQEAVAAMVGKKLSYMETVAYLQSDWRVLLTGGGIGRFSSLAAHRISGGDTGRIFRKIPTYKTPVYLENHGLITQTRLAAPPAQYATSNWPESFYNQLFGEYGLLGAGLFLVFYILHFLKRGRRISYGFWAAAVMVPFGIINYLFEAFCPVIFLECLLELNAAERAETVV